jgi:hypothetical protein
MSDDLAARRARHQPYWPYCEFSHDDDSQHSAECEGPYCRECSQDENVDHPCDAAVLGAALAELQAVHSECPVAYHETVDELLQERQARQAAEANARWWEQDAKDTLDRCQAAEAQLEQAKWAVDATLKDIQQIRRDLAQERRVADARVNRAEAERDRYRATLARIHGWTQAYRPGDAPVAIDVVRQVDTEARQALAGEA